ncbi:chromate efflux transporter [bacterium]|nr:chromate efflux transporter [bacterium]
MRDARPRVALLEVALLFLKLGTTAFGGPAAHIAMMEDEVVRRRGWLSRERFLDLLGATNLIPGPNSTELAIHVGHHVAGWRGLLIAGACFILPATLIVGAIAWLYTRFGALPAMAGLLVGVKPVVIAVVAQALWGLGRTALKSRLLAVAALGALVLCLLGVNELAILFGTGGAFALACRLRERRADLPRAELALLPFFSGLVPAAPVAAPVGLWPLFAFFVKVGSVLFGSGYVLLAFLRADLVQRWGWLTDAQLLDAIAVGQVTPGPVFTTATFIGYLLGGGPGAAIATLGIFLPAFCFVALSAPLIPRLRSSPTMGSFLDGLNVASLALMAAVTWQLARSSLVDPLSIGLALMSLLLLVRFKWSSVWLMACGAALGILLALRGG